MKGLTRKSEAKKTAPAQQRCELPLAHVAIIMDGNRRWAKERSLPRVIGHKEGVKSLKRLVRHAGAIGLQYMTVYAFSSENWQRSEEEVGYLLKLFTDTLAEEFQELSANGVRLKFIGALEAMPENLQKSMRNATEKTRDNTGLKLQVAINYGSRLEVTEAMRKIAVEVREGRLDPQDIDEQLVTRFLYTNEIPDPELLIRTGGEMRLSNYLLWQAAYTEFYVTPTLWPEFTPEHFDAAIEEFARRERRYGGDGAPRHSAK